jgi:hypothetical protein
MLMASLRHECMTGKPALNAGFFVAAIMMIVSMLAATPLARAADKLSEPDQQCLGCHGAAKFEKKLKNGEVLSLHVAGPAFAASVHNILGCAGCHADMTLANHPPLRKKITSVREHSVAFIEVCRQCHDDKFKQYEGSIHASLLREGNPIAPVCTDCHDPHAVTPKTASTPVADVACRKCHSSIFDAYIGSVHGKARSGPGESAAPICADCHHAHDVLAAGSGDRLKNACLGCHTTVLAAHKTWLPNTERHLEAISCPACHSPAAQRRVDLRLYNNATQQRVAEKQGVPQFEIRARSADASGSGLDALALQSLLREFSRDGGAGDAAKTTLRGRLEVRNGEDAHRLAPKSQAIKDCAACHQEGAAAFQSVTVSIVGPDGRPLRYGAQKEVLNSVISVESVGGFYAIGGTRIKLLDVLFVLALLAGAGVPLGHLTLNWLFRRYARNAAAQAAATASDAAKPGATKSARADDK